MTTPIPPAAIDASSPTSRSTFRLLAGCLGATNRDADTLRQALLAQWSEHASVNQLEHRLHLLDHSDPIGLEGVDARLAVWFMHVDAGDGRLVVEDHSVLTGLSEDFRKRLVETTV